MTAGLDPATALTAFRSCLAAVPLSRVVVSTLPPDELGRAVTAAGTPADDMLHAGIASGTGDCATPENSLERDIAMIWEEALGVTEIGAHDNFFTLGGHSVLALQIVQRCKERLNLAVTVHQLFTNRTIAGLVQALTKTASQSSGLNS